MDRRLLTAERAAIALGFALTLLGTVGAQTYLGPAQDRLSSIAEDLSKIRSQIQIMSTAQAVDNAFGQMGSMVFALNAHEASEETQAEAIRELQQRAISRRHEGVSNYLAQLGLAGAIDFQAVSQVYDKLVDAENANLTRETYRAANDFEGELAMAIVRKTGVKAIEAIRLHSEWLAADREVRQRSLVLMIVSVAGLTLVFIVTLLAESAPPGLRKIATCAEGGNELRFLCLARSELQRPTTS